MSAYTTLPKISGCAALMVLAYAWWGGVASEHEPQSSPADPSAAVWQSASSSRANTFPWFAPEVGHGDSSSAVEQSSSVDELLSAYQQGGSAPESKRQIRHRLHVLKHDSTARNRMIECFLGRHGASLAQTMYGLMRDADFKDAGLIEDLIQRLPAEAEPALKQRLIDLIADEMSSDDGLYSPVMDGYLFQLTQSRDETLRQLATSQRIWYVAKHQPDQLVSLAHLLRDPQPAVREEMYGLIESKLDSPRWAQMRLVFVPVLHDHLHAPDVVMPELERNRVSELLAALNRP